MRRVKSAVEAVDYSGLAKAAGDVGVGKEELGYGVIVRVDEFSEGRVGEG